MSKTFHFTSMHLDQTGIVALGRYSNGTTAMQIIGDDGIPLSTPTVNLEAYGEMPSFGHVFIKDYSETTGIYDALRENEIVGEKIRTVTFGHDCKAYECELTIPYEDAMML